MCKHRPLTEFKGWHTPLHLLHPLSSLPLQPQCYVLSESIDVFLPISSFPLMIFLILLHSIFCLKLHNFAFFWLFTSDAFVGFCWWWYHISFHFIPFLDSWKSFNTFNMGLAYATAKSPWCPCKYVMGNLCTVWNVSFPNSLLEAMASTIGVNKDAHYQSLFQSL